MSSVKCVLAGTVASICLFGSAIAADLPAYQPMPTQQFSMPYNWTGFYAGANAGAAFNHSKTKIFGPRTGSFSIINEHGAWSKSSDDASFIGGGQFGYNHQIGNFVLGMEADANWADIRKKIDGYGIEESSLLFGRPYYTHIWEEGVTAENKVEWFGTVRARIGYTPINRFLVYATGGLAYGSVKSSTTTASITTVPYYNIKHSEYSYGSRSSTRVGWALGAGWEYAITNNLTMRGEYLYVDLGKKSYSSHYLTDWSIAMRIKPAHTRDESRFSIVRLGLNYKFSAF